MRINSIPLFILLIVLVCSIGCSGGQPVIPEGDRSEGSAVINDEIMGDRTESSPAFLGLYQVKIDTNNMSWTIEPFRKLGSADVFESVDVTGFLTSTPCKNCVRIFNLGINSDGNLVMGMGIKHPFPAGDPSKDITGRNRADLHIFNIEGTILTDYPELVKFQGLDFASGNLVNPDGYTTYLDSMYDNIVLTESEGHPYILHFDDYSQGNFAESNPNGFADILNPSGNLVMKMGSDYSIKDYVFNITPGESLNFTFAIGCTYGFTAPTYLDRFNPVFMLPQHNKKAASEIHVGVISNNLQYTEPESSATLRIEVMDINHSVTTGSLKNQMLYESRVTYISVDAPALSNTILMNNPTAISGDGRNTPLVYEATIHNQKNSKAGFVPCLIKVKDSYPIRSNPNPALAGADIMGRLDPTTMMFSYLYEFATYQLIELEVIPCDGVELRTGVTPIDMGVDNNGNSLVGYSDKQVWKYDYDFCTSGAVYADATDVLMNIGRIDVQNDGRSIIMGDAGNC